MNASERQPSQEKRGSPWAKTQYANLVRHIPSGGLYARLRVKGKLIWRSLKTDRITVAQLRLRDVEKEVRIKAAAGQVPVKGRVLIGHLIETYRQNGFRPASPRNRKDAKALKPASLRYYEETVSLLLRSWPGIENQDAARLGAKECSGWAAKLRASVSPSVFNHALGFLRGLFSHAVAAGLRYDNPAAGIMRESELPKPLTLPDQRQFEALVLEIEKSGSGFSRPCADLVRFLAFGGFRKGEAAFVTWADCDFDRGQIIVRGHPETGLKNRTPGEVRHIPMIPEMRQLLVRIRIERPEAHAGDAVMKVRECQKALDRAAAAVGAPRITHHDLRHLFATRCIESGVDIPTVARWLGHKDGGALAMRVYGHLRDQHSAAMAQRVRFSEVAPEDVVDLPNTMTNA